MEKAQYTIRRSAILYHDSTAPLSSASDLRNFSGGARSLSLLRMHQDASILSVAESLAPLHIANYSSEMSPQHHCEELVRRLLLSTPYTVISIVCILFSMYGDAVRLLMTQKPADATFALCYIILFAVFSLDVMLQSIGRTGYFLSFSCLMDIVATLTVVVDINWVWEKTTSEVSVVNLLKDVGRAARISARSHRMIEILRLIRLLRIMKLFKKSAILFRIHTTADYRRKQQQINDQKSLARKVKIFKYGSDLKKYGGEGFRRDTARTTNPREMTTNGTFNQLYGMGRGRSISLDDPRPEVPEESEVSKLITNWIVKLVFGIVLVVVLVVPIFNWTYYTPSPQSYTYGLYLLDAIKELRTDIQPTANEYIFAHRDETSLISIIRLYNEGEIYFASDVHPDDLRSCEKVTFSSEHFMAVFDNRKQSSLIAWMDVLHVTFISLSLSLCTIFMFYDFSTTVTFGLERMISFVLKIAQNPLVLLTSTERESNLIPEKLTCCCCMISNECEYGKFEMKLLEDAIYKIGVMLVLGFGTAGCEIITQNINASGNINPLIPGKKIYAAFAFISIANFTRLASILQEDIMMYVNTVSLIVHCVCEKFQGTVNRNLGESILVVWKFQDDDLIKTGTKVSSNAWSESVRHQAAFALLSAIRVSSKLARSARMTRFHDDLRISAALPFFMNKLTIGLHVGWGVEGPVGSLLKIDATYISPDVNIAARLESATRIYGVHILASEKFVSHLDDPIQHFLRHVDTVKFKGSEEAMKIFTFDLSLQNLGTSIKLPSKSLIDRKRKQVKEAVDFNYFQVSMLFSKSKKIERMREMHSPAFLADYDSSLRLYLNKDWLKAAKLLETKCLRLLPTDGPTNALLRFMQEHKLVPPPEWTGVRVLETK